MGSTLESLQICGVHRVEPTIEQFDETIEIQWGTGLIGAKLDQARENVREHYEGLYLGPIPKFQIAAGR